MKKRWLAIFLTLAMCLSLLPIMSVADDTELPAFAYYSAPERSADYLLGDSIGATVALDPNQPTIVYLVWETEATMAQDIEAVFQTSSRGLSGLIYSKYEEKAEMVAETADTLDDYGVTIIHDTEGDLSWLQITTTSKESQQLDFGFHFEYGIGAPPLDQAPTLQLQGEETVELPTYTYFTQPERDPNCWIGGVFNQEDASLPLGPEHPMSVYLVWEKAEVIPRDIEVAFQMGNVAVQNLIHPVDPENNDKAQLAASTAAVLQEYGVRITYDESDDLAWLEIDSSTNYSHTLSFAFFNDYSVEGPPNDFAPWLIRTGEDAPEQPPQSDLTQIEIDGETYTFGFGIFFTDGRLELIERESFAVVDDSDWNGTYVLGIKDEQDNPADASIYDLVSDLEITIPDYSPSILNEGPEPTATVLEEKTYMGERAMHTVIISAKSNAYFEAEIRLDFKVDGEPYYVSFVAEKMPYSACHLQMHEDPQVIAELLSDPAAFLEWMENTYPNEYQQFVDSKDSEDSLFEISVTLPEGTFTETIDVRLPTDIHFIGSDEGEGTIMAGLRLLDTGAAFSVENVHFVASDSEAYTYDGETFTCGVLAVGTDGENPTYGEGSLIENCTFVGYDYAVRCMERGNIGLRSSIIENCDYGYYMDCGDWVSGGNKMIRGNVFSNCSVAAIHLEKLPSGWTPYELRVLYCDFLDNAKDLVIEHKSQDYDYKPNFYFYMNYYGQLNGVDSVFKLDDLNQLKSKKAQVQQQNDAVVYTNPRYTLPCNLLQDQVGDDNMLTVDNGRLTCILEDYALGGAVIDMALSSDALSQEIRESLEPILISGVDETGELLYTWTFVNTEE